MSVATEMQALADEVKARRSLFLAAMPKPRVVPAVVRESNDGYGRYGMKCVLCGGPADRFTCEGCDAVYEERGL